MDPLLKIQTVPCVLEFRAQPARMEMQQPEARLEITRDKKGLTIESEPIKIQLDTTEARSSIGMKSVRKAIDEAAKRGVQLGYEAIGRIAEDGNFLMDIHLKQNTIPALAAKSIDLNLETMIGFSPSTGPEISWNGPDLQMKYEMDKLNFDWRTNRPELKFIPGKLEFIIKEYPDVVIEYMGEPIYVPPSAAPGAQFEAKA